MASYLYVFVAPDSHIDFLKEHPNTLYAYFEGDKPSVLEQVTLPDDWPVSQPESIGPPECIDRNVDLYHWILNGKPDFVSGSGSFFQTWLTDKHSAIDITGLNENFAFKSSQVPDLAALVNRVDELSVEKAFSGWLKSRGRDLATTAEGCKAIADEFRSFGQKLEEATTKGLGLVWIAC